jgi:hypothetical protein
VKDFPVACMEQLRERAVLKLPPDAASPRRIAKQHLQRTVKKPTGYTKAIRSTRRKDKMQQTRGGSHKAA